jgi:anti-sigma regulatory factor (Ser/Thr protein kinase)
MDPTPFMPQDGLVASVQLPSNVESAEAARRFVAENADGLDPEVVADAQLLASEIVTNAVLHGRPDITCVLRVEPPCIGLIVADRGEAIPQLPSSPPDPAVATGRGMLIVDAIASVWGVFPNASPPGKAVWFLIKPAPSGRWVSPSFSNPEV